ncbi:MAG: chitobiase/beta-hexosaminidase C-terminal domain-containing protein [Myxococcota bacterium]
MKLRHWFMSALLLVGPLAGCNCQPTPPEAENGETQDAATITTDAGQRPDAAGGDAGVVDAGAPDAATTDAGTADAGTADAGTVDAGTGDAGSPDAGDTQAPTTTASPITGTYAVPLDVTLTSDEPATIHYTTDGTTPDLASPSGASPLTIQLTTSATLTFFAVDPSGNAEQPHAEVYTLDGDAPVLSNDTPSGSFNAPITVTVTSNEPATLHYTTTGADPDTTSPSASDTLQLQIQATTTLKVIGVDAVGNTSAVSTWTYAFDDVGPTLVSQDPQDQDADVGTYANLVLRFSEPMDRAAVEGALVVAPRSGGVDGTPWALATHWYLDAGEDVLVAWPANPADPDDVNTPWDDTTEYHVTLDAASATDLAGNALGSGADFVFTTLGNADPVVVALQPDPGTLASPGLPEVSVTFDRNMDVTRGRIEVREELFEGALSFQVGDPEVSWNAAARKLTLDTSGHVVRQHLSVRFTELHKANGDPAPDVFLQVLIDRSGTTDTAPPLLDSPSDASGPVSLDPHVPVLWFSETLDPATLDAITAAPAAGGPQVDLAPRLTLFGRAVLFSTTEMTPGTVYAITLGTGLLDTAGNPLAAPVTLDVEVPLSFQPGDVEAFGLVEGDVDLPLRNLQMDLRMPQGWDQGSIRPGSVRLSESATGTPVRGFRIQPPSPYALTRYATLLTPPGVPALRPDTGYTVEVQGLTGVGGADLFPNGPFQLSFTTVGEDLLGDPDDARPLFVADDTRVSLSIRDTGVSLDTQVQILDDSASHVVSVTGLGGALDVLVPVDPEVALRWRGEISLSDPGFVDGRNDVALTVDDGTREVAVTLPVSRFSDAEIPTISSPADGAVLDVADIPALTLEWTAQSAPSDRTLVVLAESQALFGGGEGISEFAVVPSDAATFNLGARWGDLMEAGKTYAILVLKQATRDGLEETGGAFIFGRTLVLVSVRDPSLGSISGTITLRAPVAARPVVLLFDQFPVQDVDPVAFYFSSPGADEVTYSYTIPNLVDGTYYLAAAADVLGNDVGSDPTSDDDNVFAWYGAGPDPVVVSASGTQDHTGVDVTLDNWPGAIDLSGTSDTPIQGEVHVVICDDTASTPPFDPACSTRVVHDMAGATSDTFLIRYVEDGSWTVWVIADVDGDGELENHLATEATPSPVVVSGDVEPATVSLTVPTGSISGTFTTSSALDQEIVVALWAGNDTPGVDLPYLVVSVPHSGDQQTFPYALSFIPDGTWQLVALVNTDGDPQPEAIHSGAPTFVTITNGSAETYDGTITIP